MSAGTSALLYARGRLIRGPIFLVSAFLCACLPRGDLDRLSAGANGGSGGDSPLGDSAPGDVGDIAPRDAAAGGGGSGGSDSSVNREGGSVARDDAALGAGGNASAGGTSSGGLGGNPPLADSGVMEGAARCGETAGFANAPLPDPAAFSEDSPIAGEVQLSAESSWEIAAGVFQQAYQVRTPTAIYFLHLASGSLVSLTDPSAKTQWIQYSYGGQPDRGIPLLGGCCSPPANGNPAPLVAMKTLKDDVRSSTTHLHVDSSSNDGNWRLSWDFYLTHATVTVEQAGAEYGFSYKGTPGGPAAALNTDLWLSNGEGKKSAATYAANKDLSYPESARFADTANSGQSLFLVQHRDDCLSDSYQPRSLPTEKTAVFTFGGGKIPAARRTRFSFGLATNADAEARITYVVNLMK